MNVTAIDPEQIDHELDQRGYFVINDAEIAAACAAARTEYERCLQTSEVHAPREKFHYSSLSSEPWRKLAIGSSNGIGDPYAQNLQSVYFDANDSNYPALGSLFRFMIAVRNRLMRLDLSFGDNPERDRFWNAARSTITPAAANSWRCTRTLISLESSMRRSASRSIRFQLLFSRKNVDFFSGGGFVINHCNEKVDLETEGGFGSLVLFDGRTYHGVEDVDLDQVIDFSRSDGKLAAFVNFYSVI